MKLTCPRSFSLATTLGLIAVTCTWSAAQEDRVEPPAAPSNATLLLVASSSPSDVNQPDPLTTQAELDVASARWTDIKDNTFERRDLFLVGLRRLQAQLDLQIGGLVAKRAAMEGIVETVAWDFAMKEMENARSYLKSMGEEATNATVDTWNQMKLKVEYAWVRTQNAYGKVKSSTTI